MKYLYTVCLIIVQTLFLLNNLYSQSFSTVWAKSAGGKSDDIGRKLARDQYGNVYITGNFYSDTITFNNFSHTNKGNSDIFIAKYDNQGNLQWMHTAGGMGMDYCTSICLDAFGNVYISGQYHTDPIEFGFGSIILNNLGYDDIFIAKYDPNGNLLWAKNYSTTSSEGAISTCADKVGNVYLAGQFTCGISFDTIVHQFPGTCISGAYVVKLNSNGIAVWANWIENGGIDQLYNINYDTISNQIHIAGEFYGYSEQIGNNILLNTQSGTFEMFIARFDTSGNVTLAKRVGSPGDDYSRYIISDASGNIYVAGIFDSYQMNFGSTILTNYGGRDVFLVKYDYYGNVIWAKNFGGTSWEEISGIYLDSNNKLHIIGSTISMNLNFNGIFIPNTFQSLFIASYDHLGNVISANKLISTGFSSVLYYYGGALDSNDDLLLTGRFTPSVLPMESDTLFNCDTTGLTTDIFVLKLSQVSVTNSIEYDDQKQILLWPNPTESILNISSPGFKNSSLFFYDITGQVLIKRNFNEHANLNIETLKEGIYIVEVRDNNGKSLKKKIIRQ